MWHKIRKDGGSDGRGVGFYFRNVTELVLFGVRGKNARTLAPGRKQVNYLATRKREHSRKPDDSTASSKHAARVPISNSSPGARDLAGPSGATRRSITHRHGRPTAITQPAARLPSSIERT